ncbi:DUF3265 domain-containing protein [Vibrio parahaemolyticus]|nr:DUF3265 domain-containing protein [Vibrio parahaemolyticus]
MFSGNWHYAKILSRSYGVKCLTNASRRIRNAWHFHHALIVVV